MGTPVLTPTRCQHGDGSAEHRVISGAARQIVLQHHWWPSGSGQSPPEPAGGASGGQPEPEKLSVQVGNRKLQRNLAGEYKHSLLHGETLVKQHSEQSVSNKDNSLKSISLQAQTSCCCNTLPTIGDTHSTPLEGYIGLGLSIKQILQTSSTELKPTVCPYLPHPELQKKYWSEERKTGYRRQAQTAQLKWELPPQLNLQGHFSPKEQPPGLAACG